MQPNFKFNKQYACILLCLNSIHLSLVLFSSIKAFIVMYLYNFDIVCICVIQTISKLDFNKILCLVRLKRNFSIFLQ